MPHRHALAPLAGYPIPLDAESLRVEMARYNIRNIDVAADMGTSDTLIASYRTGERRISPAQASRLATAFNERVGVEVFIDPLRR